MGKKLNSLGEIGPLLEEFANDLLRLSILETDARVKQASPVLSGRLRNSWMIGENSEAGQPAERKEYGENIPPAVAINYTQGQETIGNTYSIHNNLEYAEAACFGTNLPPSWQGDFKPGEKGVVPGFPDLIAKEMQAFVDQKAREFRRKF